MVREVYMLEFNFNIPSLPETTRRRQRVDWQPAARPVVADDAPAQPKQVDQKAIQNLMNPQAGATDNPYDFGGNLEDM